MFVQVVRHGSRRELRLPAEKTVSYINLFTVSVHGFVRGLETSEKNEPAVLATKTSQECDDTESELAKCWSPRSLAHSAPLTGLVLGPSPSVSQDHRMAQLY